MSEIKEWSFTLSTVIIFGTLVEAVSPNKSYRKYIHFVLGILMIISISRPIFGYIGKSRNFEIEPYDKYGYVLSAEEIEIDRQKKVIDVYKKTLTKSIVTNLNSTMPNFSDMWNINLNIDESENNFGRILSVSVIVDEEIKKQTDDDEIEQKIKKCVADTLGISYENVSVVI